MNTLKFSFALSFLITCIHAQDITAELDSVELPSYRIFIFDETILPPLTEAQKLKYALISIDENIADAKREITEQQLIISEWLNEKQKLLTEYNEEKSTYNSLLLGLFSTESKTKKDSIIYDQKSIFWGAFKWGELKDENDE